MGKVFIFDYFRGNVCSMSVNIPSVITNNKVIYITADIDYYSGNKYVIKTALENSDIIIFYFTNNTFTEALPKNIHVCKVNNVIGDARFLAKYPKICPFMFFPHCKYSVWFDANVLIKKNFILQFNKFVGKNTFFLHSKRQSIFDEISEVKKHSKDSLLVLNKWEYILKILNFNDNLLLQGRFFVLYNDINTNRFCVSWLNYVKNFSIRDQLSLPVSIFNHNLDLNTLRNSDLVSFINIYPHSKYNIGIYENSFLGKIKFFISKLRYNIYRFRYNLSL